MKKHCVANHHCYKDFPAEECSWAKRYASSEDLWNYYSNHLHENVPKKKDLEAVPKRKKKLQIIDPNTGKNVLETVNVPCPEQSDTDTVEENSKLSENHMIDEKHSGDYFCSDDVNDETPLRKTSNEQEKAIAFPSDGKMYDEKLKCSDALTDLLSKTIRDYSNNKETCDNSFTSFTDDAKERNSIYEKAFLTDMGDGNAVGSSEVKKNVDDLSKETSSRMDCHSNCQAHGKKEGKICMRNKNVSVWDDHSDTMQKSLRQIRENTYSVKQEQQRLAILQSFLRFKKYQLEESARNLDEKRIKIANWECNLYNKSKKLRDKELLLENKSEMLCSKAQQLAEKEKLLKEEENKILADTHFSKDGTEEKQCPEKKFAFNCNDTTRWDDIPMSFTSEDSNDYSGYCTNPCKVPESEASDVDKCKSEAYSLDELERNIVMIEKMHSFLEENESTVDKADLTCSSVSKTEENASCDPLEYSKGRRYLPEHIKYWLNKRDKNA